MQSRLIRLALSFVVVCVGFFFLAIHTLPAFAVGGGIGLPGYVVSLGALTSEGEQISQGAYMASLSGDGRLVAFLSWTSDLDPGPGNPGSMYLHDRASGQTERVSLTESGAMPDYTTYNGSISDDGQYAVYASNASNILIGQTDYGISTTDIFVYDRSSGVTKLVSHVPGSSTTTADFSSMISRRAISSDGRRIAFWSRASNLVPGDTNNFDDVFIYDTLSDTFTRILGMGGTEPYSEVTSAVLASNGRYVAFMSGSPNFVPNDTNGRDIFVADLETGAIQRVSVSSSGTQGNGDSFLPTISGDGRYVAFTSNANNLVPGDNNDRADVFVHDSQTGYTNIVSVSTSNQQGNAQSSNAEISADGRSVLFSSYASTLVAGDTNNSEDVFLRDLQSNETTLVSVNHMGTPHSNGSTLYPYISPNGQVIAYISNDATIVVGDDNGDEDVFIYAPPTLHYESTLFHGAEGETTIPITVTLDAPWTVTATVAYSTADGTATAPSDYTAVNGTLAFPPGVTERTFDVPIVNDTTDEVAETVVLALASETPGILVVSPMTATAIIEDNDGPSIMLSTALTTVLENDTLLHFTATLSTPSVEPVTVNYSTVGGTATPGSDYTPASGVLTFAPGATTAYFTVELIEDFLEEPDEIFALQLSNPDNATLGSPSSVTVTIENDDGAPMTVPVNAPSNPTTPVTVTFTTELGTIFITLTEVISDGVLTATVRADPLTTPPAPYVTLPTYLMLESDGFAFGQVEIRMPYRASEVLAGNIPEASLRLLSSHGAEWKERTSALDMTLNRISGVSESLGTFVVAQLPIPECAVTINNGATHTGVRTVNLFSQMDNAAEMLVGNDAGFPGSTWQPYTTNLSWTLTNPGPQISTLLAYVRVRDGNGVVLCGGLTLSDDVIYDPLPPNVTIQTKRAAGEFTFILDATDQQNGSGVTDMQVSLRSDFLGAAWQPYSPTVTIDAPGGATVYARVRDGVGNRSQVVTVVAPQSASKLYLPVLVRQRSGG